MQLVVAQALPRAEQLERLLVQHHALDRARERLAAEGGPQPELLEEALVFEKLHLVLARFAHAHALEEVVPLVSVHRLEEYER